MSDDVSILVCPLVATMRGLPAPGSIQLPCGVCSGLCWLHASSLAEARGPARILCEACARRELPGLLGTHPFDATMPPEGREICRRQGIDPDRMLAALVESLKGRAGQG